MPATGHRFAQQESRCRFAGCDFDESAGLIPLRFSLRTCLVSEFAGGVSFPIQVVSGILCGTSSDVEVAMAVHAAMVAANTIGVHYTQKNLGEPAVRTNDYDAMASAYSADIEHNAWNALYERPAILALAGNVAGLHVLDAACGSGIHAKALIERGAKVSGFDLSSGLLAIARKRLGNGVPLIQADLRSALPYKDAEFDMVFTALAMHYVEDWEVPFREFARVLRQGGRLVFSTHHPFMHPLQAQGENYFATYPFDEMWERGSQQFSMRFWHRPLSAMVKAINNAGFSIETIDEPMPLEQARDQFPEEFQALTTSPRFLFFSARKA